MKLCDNDKNAVNEDNQTYSDFVKGSRSALGYSKVVGIDWDNNLDTFVFDLRNIVDFAKSLSATNSICLENCR